MCNCKPSCIRHTLTDEEMKKLWRKIDKMGVRSLMNFRSEIEEALAGFVDDPADSDYQKGYQAALEEVLRNLNDMINNA